MPTTAALAAVLLLSTGPARAENRFVIDPVTFEPGDTGRELSLRIDSDQDILGFSVGIDYDPAVLAVTDVAPAGVADRPETIAIGEFTGGRIKFGIVVGFDLDTGEPLPPLPPLAGEEALTFTVDVLATADTTTDMVFRNGEADEGRNIMTDDQGFSITSIVTEDAAITICEADTCIPDAPTCLLPTSSTSSSISVSWDDNSGIETGFELERLGPSGVLQTFDLPADTTGYTDTSVAPEILYEYRVRALGTNGPSAYSNSLLEMARTFDLAKAVGKLGKKGWVLKLARLGFDPGTAFYEGDASEIRVIVDGLSFFEPESILKQKIKLNKKTGETTAIILKDVNKNVFKLNLKKRILKVVLKNIAPDDFDPSDGSVSVEVAYSTLLAGIDLPAALTGKKLNKLLFAPPDGEPPPSGEFLAVPELNPCTE